jgi:transcriptional regulator with XRE-family HTH domain
VDRLVDLGRFIQDQRRRTQLSVKRLSDLSGISNTHLSQIERGLRKPSTDVLKQLANALSISAESLFARAGIRDTTSRPVGVIEAIHADADLNDEQKASLVQVYESFRAAATPPAMNVEGEPKPTVARNRRPPTEVD